MRLLLISIISVVLFFPTYWGLYPIFGRDWGAGIASFMMFLGFPMLLLHKWGKPSTNPIIKACNHILAMLVLVVLVTIAYSVVFEGAPIRNGFGLLLAFVFYGGLAGYFIRHGYMPYQAGEVATESQEDESK